MTRVRWAHRCTATAKSTGLPCRAWAMEGGFLCVKHCGATGRIRRKAQQRLAVWKLERRLHRELRPVELAFLGDRSAFQDQIRALTAELRR